KLFAAPLKRQKNSCRRHWMKSPVRPSTDQLCIGDKMAPIQISTVSTQSICHASLLAALAEGQFLIEPPPKLIAFWADFTRCFGPSSVEVIQDRDRATHQVPQRWRQLDIFVEPPSGQRKGTYKK